MKKLETQWVMVEAVSMFRQRYLVEVPVGTDAYGKDKAEWALDTVTLEEAKEFSQKHLGETIIGHRIVTEQEALEMCDVDNEYCKKWNDDLKKQNFFTSITEHMSDTDYS